MGVFWADLQDVKAVLTRGVWERGGLCAKQHAHAQVERQDGEVAAPGGRPMTFEEKRRLSQGLGALAGDKLGVVMEIIAESQRYDSVRPAVLSWRSLQAHLTATRHALLHCHGDHCGVAVLRLSEPCCAPETAMCHAARSSLALSWRRSHWQDPDKAPSPSSEACAMTTICR